MQKGLQGKNGNWRSQKTGWHFRKIYSGNSVSMPAIFIIKNLLEKYLKESAIDGKTFKVSYTHAVFTKFLCSGNGQPFKIFAGIYLFKPLRMNMPAKKNLRLTEEELLNLAPQFKDLTPEKKAELIEFVYQMSLVFYNGSVNSQNFKDNEA
ncbi:hypothetical protein [Chitinophaga defluvii]|uniref:Uncharacterized protein n=1 Tax=Chitinophaga defluvii TaxID=3163343 RepID=A0ABV2TDC2_9BACT